jgi:hypothetical protein
MNGSTPGSAAEDVPNPQSTAQDAAIDGLSMLTGQIDRPEVVVETVARLARLA